mgnify:CR=1 FL=1
MSLLAAFAAKEGHGGLEMHPVPVTAPSALDDDALAVEALSRAIEELELMLNEKRAEVARCLIVPAPDLANFAAPFGPLFGPGPGTMGKQKKGPAISRKPLIYLVAREGIEPPTLRI